jgi:NAD(P)-dependent dehydrogenase (short-subunit alcohol dehydrogenase family)
LRFENDAVVITGAAQGLGRAVAAAFAYEGAHVVIADLNEEAALTAAAVVQNRSTSNGGLLMD